jgi:hypothetical protein
VKLYRHAALALVGWYLMLPSVENGKVRNLPVQEWVHVESFDTAKECAGRRTAISQRQNKQATLIELLPLTDLSASRVTIRVLRNRPKRFYCQRPA